MQVYENARTFRDERKRMEKQLAKRSVKKKVHNPKQPYTAVKANQRRDIRKRLRQHVRELGYDTDEEAQLLQVSQIDGERCREPRIGGGMNLVWGS